jgi:hypothetical protein
MPPPEIFDPQKFYYYNAKFPSQEKCKDRTQLIEDITTELYKYFQNDVNMESNDKIQSSPDSISLTDNDGVIHSYFLNNSPNNYINLDQTPNYSFFGDVSANVDMTIKNYKLVDNPNPNPVLGKGQYYQSIDADSYGYKIISDSSLNLTNGCYSINKNTSNYYYQPYDPSCVGTNGINYKTIKDPSDNLDIFVKNLVSMSFNVYPDYSSINIYDKPSNTTSSTSDTYDPHASDLIELIADYYMSLCENQEKAEIYQDIIKETLNGGSDEMYENTMDNYYREYGRIINISVGILFTIGVLYQLSK